MLARAAKKLGVPLYEVPVGFKYFGPLYEEGKIAFSGEESAGASFIAKDGSVWTTDKDGIILCLLLRKSTPLRENRRWLTMRNSVLN